MFQQKKYIESTVFEVLPKKKTIAKLKPEVSNTYKHRNYKITNCPWSTVYNAKLKNEVNYPFTVFRTRSFSLRLPLRTDHGTSALIRVFFPA